MYATFAEAADATQYPILPGVEMFGHRSKLLLDGVFAALELQLENPVGSRWPGKGAWILGALSAQKEMYTAASPATKDAHERALVFLAVASLLNQVEPAGLPGKQARQVETPRLHIFGMRNLRRISKETGG